MGMTGALEIGVDGSLDGSRAELRGQLCIGGVSIRIAGIRGTDVVFDSEHEPFRVGLGAPDIDLGVGWVADLAPTPGHVLFDSGATWRLYQREDGFQFDFIATDRPYKRLFVDNLFRRATLEMSSRYFDAFPHLADPLGYPLDELLIMHRLTQEKAIELHSCGIVRSDGTGNLFVGHSGAGKSTTTRLWTACEDVEVLSDDRIIVRRDEGGDVQIPCDAAGRAGEHEVLRLRDSSASRTSHFAQDDNRKKTSGMRMYGTPWHGEAAYASPGSAPLSRIFILEHGHGNVLTRLSPSQAVAELFARSFVPFHKHEYVDSALEFLQELVGAVPCYHYAFEPDQCAVDTILNFHD
jgi:hypothetical protein